MSTEVRTRMTLHEYLALEAHADVRHEFVNGEIVAMAGASKEHNAVREGLSTAVRNALAASGRRCLALGADQRVRISETGLFAYPDMTVVCGKPEFDATALPESLLNPLVVFEVLSESTEGCDLGAKAAHYRSRASVQEIVFVSSADRRVEVLRRGEGVWWQSAIFAADAVVPIACLGIEVPLSAIYEQLDLL